MVFGIPVSWAANKIPPNCQKVFNQALVKRGMGPLNALSKCATSSSAVFSADAFAEQVILAGSTVQFHKREASTSNGSPYTVEVTEDSPLAMGGNMSKEIKMDSDCKLTGMSYQRNDANSKSPEYSVTTQVCNSMAGTIKEYNSTINAHVSTKSEIATRDHNLQAVIDQGKKNFGHGDLKTWEYRLALCGELKSYETLVNGAPTGPVGTVGVSSKSSQTSAEGR